MLTNLLALLSHPYREINNKESSNRRFVSVNNSLAPTLTAPLHNTNLNRFNIITHLHPDSCFLSTHKFKLATCPKLHGRTTIILDGYWLHMQRSVQESLSAIGGNCQDCVVCSSTEGTAGCKPRAR